MKSASLKLISGVLAFTYFTTQVALGHAAESNLWMERRARVSQVPVLPPLQTPLQKSSNSSTQLVSGALSESISLQHGTIQDVFTSKDKNAPQIVLLQDVHMNGEAQTNISALLAGLIDHRRVGLIGVEGAFERFDFAPFRSIPDRKILRDVVQSFFKQGLIAAPSYAGLISTNDSIQFVGIDDRTHYDANVSAVRLTAGSKEKAIRVLQQIRSELNDRKKSVLSEELNRFVSARDSYHEGSLGLGKYIQHLSRLHSTNDPVIKQFLSALELEDSLDLPAIEQERKIVLEKLAAKLGESELNQLVQQSLEHRLGRLSFTLYYKSFQDLCQKNGLSLSTSPRFSAYIRYATLSEQIKHTLLFERIHDLEKEIQQKLAQTPEQKSLLLALDQTSMATKLIKFELTPDEWETYQSQEAAFPIAVPNIGAFESFYREADIRSEKMVGNLLSNEVGPGAALVVGGFHTPHITQLLRQKNVSYVVVSPKITKIDSESGSAYLSVFSREKTPLDKLFQGQKLFLAPETQNITSAPIRFRLLSVAWSAINRTTNVTVTMGKNAYNAHVEILDKANYASAEVTLTGWQKFYLTLGVQWEIIVQWIVPASAKALQLIGLTDPFVCLPLLVVAWIISALVFSAIHPNRSQWDATKLFAVGLLLGSPFLIPNLGFWMASFGSGLTHLIYNGLILAGILKGMPLASVRMAHPSKISITEIEQALQADVNGQTLRLFEQMATEISFDGNKVYFDLFVRMVTKVLTSTYHDTSHAFVVVSVFGNFLKRQPAPIANHRLLMTLAPLIVEKNWSMNATQLAVQVSIYLARFGTEKEIFDWLDQLEPKLTVDTFETLAERIVVERPDILSMIIARYPIVEYFSFTSRIQPLQSAIEIYFLQPLLRHIRNSNMSLQEANRKWPKIASDLLKVKDSFSDEDVTEIAKFLLRRNHVNWLLSKNPDWDSVMILFHVVLSLGIEDEEFATKVFDALISGDVNLESIEQDRIKILRLIKATGRFNGPLFRLYLKGPAAITDAVDNIKPFRYELIKNFPDWDRNFFAAKREAELVATVYAKQNPFIDREEFFQIIQHLLHNVGHLRVGDKLTMVLEMKTILDRHWLHIRVFDNGPGFRFPLTHAIKRGVTSEPHRKNAPDEISGGGDGLPFLRNQALNDSPYNRVVIRTNRSDELLTNPDLVATETLRMDIWKPSGVSTNRSSLFLEGSSYEIDYAVFPNLTKPSLKGLKEFRQKYQEKYGELPSEEDTALYFGVPVEKIEELQSESVGGLVRSVKKLVLYLFPTLSPVTYDKFIGPLLENAIVLSLQLILMSQGLDFFTAGLWSWGFFVAVHFIEWMMNPKRPANLLFSLAISAISLILPTHAFAGYAFFSTLFHIGANHIGALLQIYFTPKPVPLVVSSPLSERTKERLDRFFKQAAENPDVIDSESKEWMLRQLTERNTDNLFTPEEMVRLSEILTVLFNDTFYEIYEGGTEIHIVSLTKSGKQDGRRWNRLTGEIITEQNPNYAQQTRRVYEIFKEWNYLHGTNYPSTSDDEKQIAHNRFFEKITRPYGIRLDTQFASAIQIHLVIELLLALPPGMLKRAAQRLRTIELNTDAPLGEFFNGKISMSRKRFQLRDFVETFLHELGHVFEPDYLAQFEKTFSKLRSANGYYKIPALGLPASERFDYIHTDPEFKEVFAESFMHFILHRSLFKRGFNGYIDYSVPRGLDLSEDQLRNYVNALWTLVYAGLRNKIFHPKTPEEPEVINPPLVSPRPMHVLFGVQWEVIFHWLIPAAALLGIYGQLAAWIVSAVLFASFHPNKERWDWTKLFIVGLGFGVPFLIPTLSFEWANIASMSTHFVYSGLKLLGFMKKMPWASVTEVEQIPSESAEYKAYFDQLLKNQPRVTAGHLANLLKFNSNSTFLFKTADGKLIHILWQFGLPKMASTDLDSPIERAQKGNYDPATMLDISRRLARLHAQAKSAVSWKYAPDGIIIIGADGFGFTQGDRIGIRASEKNEIRRLFEAVKSGDAQRIERNEIYMLGEVAHEFVHLNREEPLILGMAPAETEVVTQLIEFLTNPVRNSVFLDIIEASLNNREKNEKGDAPLYEEAIEIMFALLGDFILNKFQSTNPDVSEKLRLALIGQSYFDSLRTIRDFCQQLNPSDLIALRHAVYDEFVPYTSEQIKMSYEKIKEKQINSTSQLLADLALAVQEKRIDKLALIQSFGVGELNNPQFSNEAELLTQIEAWLQSNQSNENTTRLILFKANDATSEQRQISAMARIIQAGMNNQLSFVVDAESEADVRRAVDILTRAGLLKKAVSITVDAALLNKEQISDDDLTILRERFGKPSLIYMQGITPENPHADIIVLPAATSLNITNIGILLRQVLVAA